MRALTGKQLLRGVGGTTNNAVSEWSMVVDPAVCHLEVEFTGNTAQSITCEAFVTQLAGL